MHSNQAPNRNIRRPGERPASRPSATRTSAGKRRRKAKLKPGALLILLIFAAAVFFLVKWVISLADDTPSKKADSRTSSSETEETLPPEPTPTPTPTPVPVDLFAGIHSSQAILVDADDLSVINEKMPDEVVYPASLTKMMTALVISENIDDLDKNITITRDIGDALYNTDASLGGFEIDETAPARDLLYGILLRSGAECCLALANDVAGSEEEFVVMMNDKAKELGLTNTHFMNCTGLQDPSHYSSCRDMAIILDACMKDPLIKSIMMTKSYNVPPTNVHTEGFTMFNTLLSNFTLPEDAGFVIEGGKTGYTGTAGQCLASFAKIDGHEYILVTVGAFGNPDMGDSLHIDDAKTVYAALRDYLKTKDRSQG